MRIRKRILQIIERMKKVQDRIVATYTTIIRRLTRSRAATRDKDRKAKLGKEIVAYRDQLTAAKEVARGYGFDVEEAKLDISALDVEGAELRGTTAQPRDPGGGADAADAGEPAPSFDPRGDLQAIANQAQARADRLQQDLGAAQANLAVFTGPGDIAAGGANAFAAATFAGPAGTGPAPNLATPAGLQAFAAAGGELVVVQNEFRSLLPPNNVEQERIANTVVTALGQQGHRETTSQKVG